MFWSFERDAVFALLLSFLFLVFVLSFGCVADGEIMFASYDFTLTSVN